MEVRLHRDAPPKPAPGVPCNGCGVCCAAETCPLARLRFLQARGPCPALVWSAESQRYGCGLLGNGPTYFWGIPLSRRLVARWIAAGKGCDSMAEITPATD